MGIDSRAYIPYLNRDDLTDFLKYFCRDVQSKSTHYDDYQTISFSFGQEDRMLHTHNLELRYEEFKKYYLSKGWDWNYEETELASYIEDGLPGETYGLLLDFSLWGSAVELLTIICKKFGGYLDESDSDDESFYEIEKNYRDVIRIIMHI